MRGHSLARVLFAAIQSFCLLANPQARDAHPMGNFSINHYAGISVEPGFIEVRYLIDMAEIPTYQEILNAGINPKEGDPSLPAYLGKKAETLAGGLVPHPGISWQDHLFGGLGGILAARLLTARVARRPQARTA